jgi:CxxC-x17-CxxC domain-containing protein
MRGNGGGNGGGERSGGGRPREMFTATCSQCGGVAEVPFNPRGDKPVYCRDCFASRPSYR